MPEEIVVIKKYANRRLYNTETSTYVTLDDLSEMVKEGRDFEVVDAKAGTDITRQVLTQIIFEEETNGTALMPISFLRQMIRFYGDSLQGMVPSYLEASMDMFNQNRDKMQGNVDQLMGALTPFNMGVKGIEAMQKKNIDMFSNAFNMFSPFSLAEENADKEIEDISKQIEMLTEKLNTLKNNK